MVLLSTAVTDERCFPSASCVSNPCVPFQQRGMRERK